MGKSGIKASAVGIDRGWGSILKTVKALEDADSYVKVGVLTPKKRPPALKKVLSKMWKQAQKEQKNKGKKPRKKKPISQGSEKTPTRLSNVELAAIHEFGATIKHPGGTPYRIGPDGKAIFLPKGDPTATGITKPHTITIPARSFIRSTFDQNREKYTEMLKVFIVAIYEQKITIEKVLNVMGSKISADIKNRVTQGEQVGPPNKAGTKRKKEAKRQPGNTGIVRTLVDTGQMIKSITWAVVMSSKVPSTERAADKGKVDFKL